MARAQASQLVTKPLRAAYLQMIDALEAGAGQARLERLLRTAYYERMRYFANRIAQTELHRAFTTKQAADLMADEEVEWVQWRLSVTHPRPDICDLHAHVDRYGLGPGVYPKPAAPLPPAHPFCRCILAPRLDLTERKGERREGAETEWLRQSDHAQRIVGSKAKWERVKKGADPMAVAYENVEPDYWPRTVAEAAGNPILPVTMGRAYDRARAGGKHAGWLKRYSELPSNLVAKGLRSLEKQAEMHRAWIANPLGKLGPDAAVEEVARLVSKKWPSDIRRIEEQMDILKGLLRERGDD